MPPKVVITNWVHPEVIKFLEPHCTLTANPSREPWSQQQVLEQVEDAVALMTYMPDTVNDAFLRQCSQLRIIACALKGYDNFDVEACTRRGVWLTIVPDLLSVPAAELTVGLLIGLARHVHEGDHFIRSGAFRGWRPLLYGTGLAGSTVGVFGMGAIGKAIAQRLHGFGCGALLYYDERRLDPVAEQRLGLTCAPFRELVAQSDFLIISVPLSEQTHHKIDDAVLKAMKPGAFLVNIARGSVVDEQAVADALATGHLAGYAADVFELEDWARADRPRNIPQLLLAQKDKTLLTPHLGSAVHRVRMQIEREAARSIVQVLQGQRPDGAVNDPISARA